MLLQIPKIRTGLKPAAPVRFPSQPIHVGRSVLAMKPRAFTMKSTRIVYVDWNSGRLALKVSDLLSMRNRSEIGGESAECRVQTERSQPITRESYRGPQLTFPQQAQPATPNISGDETGPGIPQETSKVRHASPGMFPSSSDICIFQSTQNPQSPNDRHLSGRRRSSEQGNAIGIIILHAHALEAIRSKDSDMLRRFSSGPLAR